MAFAMLIASMCVAEVTNTVYVLLLLLWWGWQISFNNPQPKRGAGGLDDNAARMSALMKPLER